MLDDLDRGVIGGVAGLASRPPALGNRASWRRSSTCASELRRDELGSVTGEIDLATHIGQLMARILGGLARKESDDKSQRIRRKHEEIAAERQGLRRRQPPLRLRGRQGDRARRGGGDREGVRAAAACGRAGALDRARPERARRHVGDGRRWSPQSCAGCSASPRISGQREHHGEIVANAEWPAIISADGGAKIRALLAEPGAAHEQGRPPLPARRAAASAATAASGWSPGRARAASAAMPARRGRASAAAARPTSTPTRSSSSWPSRPAPARLARACSERMSGGSAKRPTRSAGWQEIEHAQAQLDELADRLRAARDHDGGVARRAQADRAAPDRRPQAAREVTRTSVLDGYLGNGDALRAEWDSLDLSQQHAIVAAVLDSRRRRPRAPRLQPLRRVTPDAASGGPEPSSSATFASASGSRQLHRDVLVRAGTFDPRHARGPLARQFHCAQQAGGPRHPSTLD